VPGIFDLPAVYLLTKSQHDIVKSAFVLHPVIDKIPLGSQLDN
jgi:hypothetical protein